MKNTYFVKALSGQFVKWQGYQVAESVEQAIELAKMYHRAGRAVWSAELA